LSVFARVLASVLALCACAPGDGPDRAPATDAPAPPPDTAGVAAPAPADTLEPGDATIDTDRVGPLRLGQSESDVRTRPVRDTTWQIEGMEERGVVAAVGLGEATVLLSNGAVNRIIVRDPALKTAAGLGVGSTLGQLRAAYGKACAAAGERGGIVVWLAGLPGVSFALDQPLGPDLARIERDAALLPDSARVEELWVHGGHVAC
jgi:hypothetical protein